ncbi:unnamed protein product, partial [Symbiodinium microadriaticum]
EVPRDQTHPSAGHAGRPSARGAGHIRQAAQAPAEHTRWSVGDSASRHRVVSLVQCPA